MSDVISVSQFYMWRTLFAVAHADEILAPGEVEYMANILEDVNFSEEQTQTLKDDIENPKDIEKMFAGITKAEDRLKFFNMARGLVWADGDFCKKEQSTIIRLAKAHCKKTDFDELIGTINLELEEEKSLPESQEEDQKTKRKGFIGILCSF